MIIKKRKIINYMSISLADVPLITNINTYFEFAMRTNRQIGDKDASLRAGITGLIEESLEATREIVIHRNNIYPEFVKEFGDIWWRIAQSWYGLTEQPFSEIISTSLPDSSIPYKGDIGPHFLSYFVKYPANTFSQEAILTMWLDTVVDLPLILFSMLNKHLYQEHKFDKDHALNVLKSFAEKYLLIITIMNSLQLHSMPEDSFTLSNILTGNIRKLAKRYPEGFFNINDSVKRSDILFNMNDKNNSL